MMCVCNQSGPQGPGVAPQVSWTGPVKTPGTDREGRQAPARLQDLGIGFGSGEVGRRDRVHLRGYFSWGCVYVFLECFVYSVCSSVWCVHGACMVYAWCVIRET